MTRGRRASMLGSAMLAIASPLLIGSTGLTTNLDARVLAAHNRERGTLGVPALRWSDDLAASARVWADYLAATGGFRHAPDGPGEPQGENLWAGSSGYYSAEAMVDAWVREKRYYKPGTFPHNSTTGRTADIGHYTQLIWRRTTHVGCALADGRREQVLVCRYSQAGNYVGERPI